MRKIRSRYQWVIDTTMWLIIGYVVMTLFTIAFDTLTYNPIPRLAVMKQLGNQCDLDIKGADEASPLAFWQYWLEYAYFSADIKVSTEILKHPDCYAALMQSVWLMPSTKVTLVFYQPASREIVMSIHKNNKGQ